MSKKSKRPYDEVSVVRTLSKKRGCVINGKTIEVSKDQTDLGNGSWGKIDYLVKVHKYVHVSTEHSAGHYTPKTKKRVKENVEAFEKFKAKGSHPAKLNMAGMSASIMKPVAVR